MRGCEAEARRSENDLLWLTVWDRNERAIAFYRRWGMAEAGETSFTVGSQCQRDLVFIQRL
jgi:ribosomal protein S18 acetylase RimI-like enzyme